MGGEDLWPWDTGGPAIGRALRALLDQVLSETVSNEKNALLQRLAQMDAENTEKMEPCSKRKIHEKFRKPTISIFFVKKLKISLSFFYVV